MSRVNLDRQEIVEVLTDRGRLRNRVVRLQQVLINTDNPIEIHLSAEARFESSDLSLENLLDKVVPAVFLVDTAENLFVVYHLWSDRRIPVVTAFRAIPLKATFFDDMVSILAVLRKEGKRYKAQVVVTQDGIPTIEIQGEYVLVHSSEVIVRARKAKK